MTFCQFEIYLKKDKKKSVKSLSVNVRGRHVVYLLMSNPDSELPKRWLVAYVKMHHERKVKERLDAMNIESYLPIQEEVRQWSDRKKKIQRIVMPMLIFVRVDQKEQNQVLTLPAVFRYMILRGEHQPAVIPDRQMENFRFMLDFSESTVNMESEMPQAGESVRVIKGSLKGLYGELISQEGKTRIAVRIDQLGYATVELPVSYVEKV